MVRRYEQQADTAPLESYDQVKNLYWKEYQTTITPALIKFKQNATALAEMYARNPKKLTRKYLKALHDIRYEYIRLSAVALATYLEKLTKAWAQHTLKAVGITLSSFDLPKQKKVKKGKKGKKVSEDKEEYVLTEYGKKLKARLARQKHGRKG